MLFNVVYDFRTGGLRSKCQLAQQKQHEQVVYDFSAGGLQGRWQVSRKSCLGKSFLRLSRGWVAEHVAGCTIFFKKTFARVGCGASGKLRGQVCYHLRACGLRSKSQRTSLLHFVTTFARKDL